MGFKYSILIKVYLIWECLKHSSILSNVWGFTLSACKSRDKRIRNGINYTASFFFPLISFFFYIWFFSFFVHKKIPNNISRLRIKYHWNDLASFSSCAYWISESTNSLVKSKVELLLELNDIEFSIPPLRKVKSLKLKALKRLKKNRKKDKLSGVIIKKNPMYWRVWGRLVMDILGEKKKKKLL